jgi:hypothetical protein
VKLIVEKVVGPGKYEKVGAVEVSGNVVLEAFEALDITEVADYRAYPEGSADDAGFWRLDVNGTVERIDAPST